MEESTERRRPGRPKKQESPKARSRFGSIREPDSPGGKYQARYTFQGNGHSKTFDSWPEANAWLLEQAHRIEVRQYTKPSKRSFEAVATECLDNHVDIRDGSAYDYESIMKTSLLPHFGGMKFTEIDVADVRTWVKQRQKVNKPKTIRNHKALLSLIFNYAIGENYIPTGSNPCDRVKIKRGDRKEQVFLSIPQVKRLALAAGGEASLAIRTLAYCGFRAGELWDLKIRNVDLDSGLAWVVSSVDFVPKKGLVSTPAPKNYQWRSVSLPPQIVRDLREHIGDRNYNEYVFLSPKGEQINHANWRNRFWTPALNRVQFDEPPRVHDLRHTCAAIYFRHGATGEEVRRVLGHQGIQTTHGYYAHIFPEAFDRMVAGIGNVIDEEENVVVAEDVIRRPANPKKTAKLAYSG